MSSLNFDLHHDDGTSVVAFERLGLLHVNKGRTAMVAEYGQMLLVAEGEKDVVVQLCRELVNHGETYNAGRLVHTGADTRRQGLHRVRFLNWIPWHFNEKGVFTVGHPPEIAAALRDSDA